MLIYQKDDWNANFGIRVLGEVFINATETNPVKLANSLHDRFPEETFYRIPSEESLECYVPFPGAQNVDDAKVLIPETPDNACFFHASNYPRFGYLVDIASKQLHTIRGDDHLHMPANRVYETFTQSQQEVLENSKNYRHSSFFPFKTEHTYSLDALPSMYKFESDLAQSGEQYLDDIKKLGSSAKSVGAREVFALPESLKWPEIRMAYK